jgi:hypothetical protein
LTRPKAIAWITTVLGLPIAIYLLVYLSTHLSAPDLLSAEAQDRVVRYLRAAVDRSAEPALGADLAIRLRGPAWVTLYRKGEILLRLTSTDGQDLASWLRSARRELHESRALAVLDAAARTALRVKVDVTTGSGPVLSGIPIFFANSVAPGVDGLGLTVAGRSYHLLPDDLFRRDFLAGYKPFPFMDEFRTGLDLQAVINHFADVSELSRERWRSSHKRYFRFRVQSFVEDVNRTRALRVLRSRVPVDRISRADVRRALVRASDYVLRQIRPDGSFEYIYYPVNNSHSPPGDYSLPRHAGTTWFLSLAYRVLGDKRYIEGARRAVDYLTGPGVPPECRTTPYACIGTAHEGDLGSAALGAVAIVEYQQATGDKSYAPIARRLGDFMLWMQKDNGDFCHQYDPRSRKRNCKDILLYYTGEAAFGLAKLHQLTRDPRYVKPVEKALDFLTGENYDFFLGKFFISEDHWTCIAAEAAFDAVNKEQYARFCYEFAKLNARAQVQRGEGPLDDLVGAFTITPFFMPHNTPAGSRTEANVATYLLSVRRGEPQAHVLRSTLLGLRYLVDQQIRPESSYLFPDPAAAEGGMMQTPQRASIRIDFVQHAAEAMASGLKLVPEEGWAP